MKYKLFYYLPFIKLFLIWVSSISANLNFLWLTLIERPHAGLTRFYDLQWNLVSLMCKKILDLKLLHYLKLMVLELVH